MENKELRDLKTHANGAADLHETRRTAKPVSIDAPVSPNPSPLDVRTGQYENKFNEDASN